VGERALIAVFALTVLVEVLALNSLVFLVSAWLSELALGSSAHLATASLHSHLAASHAASLVVEAASLSHGPLLHAHAASGLLLAHKLLWLLSELSRASSLLIAVGPLLALKGNLQLLWVERVVGLPQLLISMCEVALIAECAILVCLVMSAALCFVFVINLVCVHGRLLDVLVLHLGVHLLVGVHHGHHHLLAWLHGHVHHVHIRGLGTHHLGVHLLV